MSLRETVQVQRRAKALAAEGAARPVAQAVAEKEQGLLRLTHPRPKQDEPPPPDAPAGVLAPLRPSDPPRVPPEPRAGEA